MARIRTIKPEAFTSESLAEVTVTAERTFFGLLTQADDHGRYRDNAAIIAGVLWPLRAEHTSVHVEDDLQQLANASLVCRYVGCDGRLYLHIVTWSEHQKIDKPSQSRLPSCPLHHAADRCGACKGVCARRPEASPIPPRGLREASASTPRALTEPSPNRPGALDPAEPTVRAQAAGTGGSHRDSPGRPEGRGGTADGLGRKSAGQTVLDEGSPSPTRNLGEGSAPGSRIVDPGSSFPTGRDAPGAGSVSAKELLGAYVASCDRRPPEDLIGHLGRIVKKLLAEGIAVEHVRAGLRRYAEIQGHPSRLPSLVNDAMNAPAGLARPGSRSTVPAHTAWTNPVDPAAYAEEL